MHVSNVLVHITNAAYPKTKFPDWLYDVDKYDYSVVDMDVRRVPQQRRVFKLLFEYTYVDDVSGK